jgi:hypothetical protein
LPHGFPSLSPTAHSTYIYVLYALHGQAPVVVLALLVLVLVRVVVLAQEQKVLIG